MRNKKVFENQEQICNWIKSSRISQFDNKDGGEMDQIDIDAIGFLYKRSLKCHEVSIRENNLAVSFCIRDVKLAEKIHKLIFNHVNK